MGRLSKSYRLSRLSVRSVPLPGCGTFDAQCLVAGLHVEFAGLQPPVLFGVYEGEVAALYGETYGAGFAWLQFHFFKLTQPADVRDE